MDDQPACNPIISLDERGLAFFAAGVGLFSLPSLRSLTLGDVEVDDPFYEGMAAVAASSQVKNNFISHTIIKLKLISHITKVLREIILFAISIKVEELVVLSGAVNGTSSCDVHYHNLRGGVLVQLTHLHYNLKFYKYMILLLLASIFSSTVPSPASSRYRPEGL